MYFSRSDAYGQYDGPKMEFTFKVSVGGFSDIKAGTAPAVQAVLPQEVVTQLAWLRSSGDEVCSVASCSSARRAARHFAPANLVQCSAGSRLAATFAVATVCWLLVIRIISMSTVMHFRSINLAAVTCCASKFCLLGCVAELQRGMTTKSMGQLTLACTPPNKVAEVRAQLTAIHNTTQTPLQGNAQPAPHKWFFHLFNLRFVLLNDLQGKALAASSAADGTADAAASDYCVYCTASWHASRCANAGAE
jgi:hypothetical protein